MATANVTLKVVETLSSYAPPPQTTSDGQSNAASAGNSRPSGGNNWGNFTTPKGRVNRNGQAWEVSQLSRKYLSVSTISQHNRGNLEGFPDTECGYCKHECSKLSVIESLTHAAGHSERRRTYSWSVQAEHEHDQWVGKHRSYQPLLMKVF